MVRRIATFVTLLILAACSSQVSEEDVEVGLLAAVPSDAVAVARCESVAMALQVLAPEDCPLREIDYGRLSKAPAALSLSYVSSLVPLLVIDAGKEVPDTSQAITVLLDEFSSKGLPATVSSFDGRKILLASTSETILPLAQRHIDIDASIVDADGFDMVLADIAHSRNAMILRNSSSARLLRGGLHRHFGMSTLTDHFNARLLSSFLQNSALWTTVDLGRQEASPIQRGDGRYFCYILRQFPSGKSVLELPDSTDFCLEVMTGEGFREKYETWLDATSKIEPYRREISSLRKLSGKDPLKWEKELGVGEVARVCWAGHEIVLLGFPGGKPSKGYQVPEVERNPYPGFIKALYCSLGTDDSCCARTPLWAVYGNEDDVRAYLDAQKRAPDKQEFTFRMSLDGQTLMSVKDKIKIIRR